MSEVTAPISGAPTQQGVLARMSGLLGLTTQGVAIIGIFFAAVASITRTDNRVANLEVNKQEVSLRLDKFEQRFDRLETTSAERYQEQMKLMGAMAISQAKIDTRTEYITGYYTRATQDRRNKAE